MRSDEYVCLRSVASAPTLQAPRRDVYLLLLLLHRPPHVHTGIDFSSGDSFQAGFAWFNMISSYTGSASMVFLASYEIMICVWLYGPHNFFRDVRRMLGPPRHLLGRLIGPTGYLMHIQLVPFREHAMCRSSWRRSCPWEWASSCTM